MYELRKSLRRRLILALAALMLAVAIPSPSYAAGYFNGAYISVFGARDYHGYVPTSYRPGTAMPLLVALHGCTENDVGFELLSGWARVAEERGFIVVFPDQNNFANPAGCWNWFLSSNRQRGMGEPALIAGITNKVRAQYSVDAKRIYVTGVSAGGVMANIMAIAYPDVYAATSILAGCEYDCDILQQQSGAAAGSKAIAQMGSRRRAVPAIIFQGTADLVVPPATADRIAAQWATIDGIDAVADEVEYGQVPGGRSYTRTTYRDAAGQSLIEQYMIDGAGHAYPGGCACSLYGDTSGPDASNLTWDFFLAHPKP